MKEENTAYNKNKNKEEPRIIFDEFPFDENGNIKKSTKRKSNTFYTFTVIFSIIALFIISSILNQLVLYGTVSNRYKTVNKFNGQHARIKLDDRKSLFKEIGFVTIYNKQENVNNKVMDVTYASNKVTNSNVNEVSVYYDEKNNVKVIDLSLVYKKDGFSISMATIECNTILRNFISVNVTKKDISKLKKNNYYFDKNSNFDITYKLVNKNKDYYGINVFVESKSSD